MDKVVSVVNHRDFVLIFMESGKIYKMEFDNLVYQQITFRLLGEVPNRI